MRLHYDPKERTCTVVYGNEPAPETPEEQGGSAPPDDVYVPPPTVDPDPRPFDDSVEPKREVDYRDALLAIGLAVIASIYMPVRAAAMALVGMRDKEGA